MDWIDINDRVPTREEQKDNDIILGHKDYTSNYEMLDLEIDDSDDMFFYYHCTHWSILEIEPPK